MARSPDWLRDRGLADHHEPPQQVVPFVIGADGLPAQPAEGVAVLAATLPEDYAARLAACDIVCRLGAASLADDPLVSARKFHAFLTATEPVAQTVASYTDE